MKCMDGNTKDAFTLYLEGKWSVEANKIRVWRKGNNWFQGWMKGKYYGVEGGGIKKCGDVVKRIQVYKD